MEKIKVLCVFGTRPEAIKMAPVILGMENDEEISTSICVTGQHRELLEQVTTLFKIHPDIDLELMQENRQRAFLFLFAQTVWPIRLQPLFYLYRA